MINQMRAVIVLVDAPRCVGDPVNLTKQAAVFRKRAGPSFVNGRPALLFVPSTLTAGQKDVVLINISKATLLLVFKRSGGCLSVF